MKHKLIYINGTKLIPTQENTLHPFKARSVDFFGGMTKVGTKSKENKKCFE